MGISRFAGTLAIRTVVGRLSFANKQLHEDYDFIPRFLVPSSRETFVNKDIAGFWRGLDGRISKNI